MRLRHGVVLIAFGLLLASTVAVGQVHGRSAELIGVSEVRPGMRGYGLTVFRGVRPERFGVEVIDVLHNFRPDQDLILIRARHPILDEAHVIAGMSGSPVYLCEMGDPCDDDGDGRLAGAYAYGWPFSEEPVAGVTPIANMVAEMRRPIRPDALPGARPLRQARPRHAAAGRSTRLAGLAPYLGRELATATTALEAHARRLGLADGPRSTSTLQPAATPLIVGGLGDAAVEALDAQLGRFGLMVLQGGGAGGGAPAADAPRRYVGGGSIGVQLVRGDVAATAVGTVTHVEGDRVAAFGHPMLNAGETGLPTAIARVLHVLSSEARSFKIAEPIRPLGALVQDRQAGIVSDSALEPATVSLVLRVHGVPNARRTEWHMQVASHRVLTPVLLNAAINNAMGATASDNADVMFEARSRIWLADAADPQVFLDRGYSHTGAANAAAIGQLRLFSVLESAYGNPFEETRVERVEIDLDLTYGRDTVQILDASVLGHEVNPGSVVAVRVTLQRYGHPEEVRVLEVPIPARLAGQDLELRIQGGGSVHVQHAVPRTLDELLETIHERYANTSLVVSLKTPSRGLRFGGHVARHLPASALDSLQLRNDADRARPFVTYDRQELPLDEVVSGTARVELSVRETPRP